MNDDSGLDWDQELGLPQRREIPDDVRERIKFAVDEGIATRPASRRSWLQVAGVAAAIALTAVLSQSLPGSLRHAGDPSSPIGTSPSRFNHFEQQALDCARNTRSSFGNMQLGAVVPATEQPQYAEMLVTRNGSTALACYDFVRDGTRTVAKNTDLAEYLQLADQSSVGVMAISPRAVDLHPGPKVLVVAGIAANYIARVRLTPPNGKPIQANLVNGTFAARLAFSSQLNNAWSLITIEAYNKAGRRVVHGTLGQYETS